MKKNIITILIVLFAGGFSFGQQEKGETKVNRFLKKVNDFLEEPASNKTNPSNPQTQKVIKTDKTSPSSLTNPNSGKLSADFVIIDVDELGQFNHGAAVVKKGNLSGLINSQGEFILPFGTVDIAQECLFQKLSNSYSHKSGIFHGVKEGKPVVFNHKGEILVTGDRGTFTFSDDGRFIQFMGHEMKSERGGFIDKNGKVYYIDRSLLSSKIKLHDGIFIDYSDRNQPVYRSVDNSIIINQKFDYYGKFNEGMAIVGKKDNYGKMKYGFINTKGEIQIPVQYSKMPVDFINGHAMVYGADGSEINYAFIDKNGKIIIQIKHNEKQHYGQLRPMANGYFFGGRYMYDEQGNYYTREEFINKIGLDPSQKYTFLEEDLSKYIANDSRFRFIIHDRIGFIDIENNIFIDAVFSNSWRSTLFFDEVSELAYAEQNLGLNPATNKRHQRKGYINKFGEFKIIIKEEKSDW